MLGKLISLILVLMNYEAFQEIFVSYLGTHGS